jgi:hypothetical protein
MNSLPEMVSMIAGNAYIIERIIIDVLNLIIKNVFNH